MTDNIERSPAVENLQRYLRGLSLYGDEAQRQIFSVPTDGIYDTHTRSAVAEFQRMNGLPINGITDLITWNLIFDAYRNAQKTDRTAYVGFFPSAPQGYETDFGEEGLFIEIIQLLLDELRISYGSLPDFERNGVFDRDTSLAVKEFQRIHLLPITGRVDRATWNSIADAYNRYGQ